MSTFHWWLGPGWILRICSVFVSLALWKCGLCLWKTVIWGVFLMQTIFYPLLLKFLVPTNAFPYSKENVSPSTPVLHSFGEDMVRAHQTNGLIQIIMKCWQSFDFTPLLIVVSCFQHDQWKYAWAYVWISAVELSKNRLPNSSLM